MKQLFPGLCLLFCMVCFDASGEERTIISLNGTRQFGQTNTAFPPSKYIRSIPVLRRSVKSAIVNR